jgi:hypothetical protein
MFKHIPRSKAIKDQLVGCYMNKDDEGSKNFTEGNAMEDLRIFKDRLLLMKENTKNMNF